ncbi:hypothetical protein DYI37_10105 [Fulvimarina endophytica]|uniref:TadE-like domain-containing protein n=1 Tax=Fulvimarina endophytica TaxID=2293836 RepID=A0A371X2D6_9HYPH|nr:TadE/TadG family type IV pilus assembly protein [Fulvimarina endophytica]RFC63388.1 hypothetical protein DYI37_10105 [Fulvimarina endophytica]
MSQTKETVPTRTWARGPLKRLRDDRRGVVAVENAFLLLPFLVLLFAILETGITLAASVVLENGVHRVGRKILTGEFAGPGGQPSREQFQQLVCDEIPVLLKCENLKIDLRTFSTYDQIALNYDPKDLRYEMGSGDEITVLRVFYEWEWIVSLLHSIPEDGEQANILSAVAAFRNEPF